MIVIDIETSGLSPQYNSILSIGAVSEKDEFYGECQVDYSKAVSEEALKINGFTKAEIYDPNKPTARELYKSFLKWAELQNDNVLAGHNVGHFDILFLEEIHKRHCSNAKFPFSYRTVDLHTLAYRKFGESLSHKQICEKLGLEPEPIPHNALSGAKSEFEAIKILLN